ncbi:MAG: formyltransferase family protein [Chloroflexota bacterium]
MRFLLLGYNPYLSLILTALAKTDFLTDNDIDVVMAIPPQKDKTTFVLDQVKSTNSPDQVTHLSKEIAVAQRTSNQHFPEIDSAFLDHYPNVQLRPYPGLNHLAKLNTYDYMIVASYAKKIPRAIFDQPKYGTLNIHPSLLPNLRGGYPTYIQAFDPSAMRGTTIHVMSDEWDDGHIVAQQVDPDITPLTNEALLLLSAKQAAELLNQLHRTKFQIDAIHQDVSQVTYCHKVLKRHHFLETMSTASDFVGHVRANYDRHLFPHVFTLFENELFIILAVEPVVLDAASYQSIKNKAIFIIEDRFYVLFDNQVFQITQGIFRGKYLKVG